MLQSLYTIVDDSPSATTHLLAALASPQLRSPLLGSPLLGCDTAEMRGGYAAFMLHVMRCAARNLEGRDEQGGGELVGFVMALLSLLDAAAEMVRRGGHEARW